MSVTPPSQESTSLPLRETAPRLRGVGLTHIGKVRQVNEDAILVREDLQVFALADGAGGHEAGDLAAELGLLSLSTHIEDTREAAAQAPDFDRSETPRELRRLAVALQRANQAVCEAAAEHAAGRGMGSTLVATLYSPRTGLLHLGHVGDSRCYRLRNGMLEQLTRDHSLLNDVLAERPDLDDGLLANLPKHVVTRALGMNPNLRFSLNSYALVEGDRFLLCSDGLSGYVPRETLHPLLAQTKPLEEVAQDLVATALEAGGRDNIAVVLFELEPEGHPRARQPSGIRLPQDDSPSGTGSDPELLILGIEELGDLDQALQGPRPGLAPEGKLHALSALILGKISR